MIYYQILAVDIQDEVLAEFKMSNTLVTAWDSVNLGGTKEILLKDFKIARTLNYWWYLRSWPAEKVSQHCRKSLTQNQTERVVGCYDHTVPANFSTLAMVSYYAISHLFNELDGN